MDGWFLTTNSICFCIHTYKALICHLYLLLYINNETNNTNTKNSAQFVIFVKLNF